MKGKGLAAELAALNAQRRIPTVGVRDLPDANMPGPVTRRRIPTVGVRDLPNAPQEPAVPVSTALPNASIAGDVSTVEPDPKASLAPGMVTYGTAALEASQIPGMQAQGQMLGSTSKAYDPTLLGKQREAEANRDKLSTDSTEASIQLENKRIEAQAAKLDAEAQINRRFVDQETAQNIQRDTEIDRRQASIDAIAQKLQAEVDPESILGDRYSRIANAISIGAGQMLKEKGGENVAMNIIKGNIEQRMKLAELNLRRDQSAYDAASQAFRMFTSTAQDQAAGRAAMRAEMYKAALSVADARFANDTMGLSQSRSAAELRKKLQAEIAENARIAADQTAATVTNQVQLAKPPPLTPMAAPVGGIDSEKTQTVTIDGDKLGSEKTYQVENKGAYDKLTQLNALNAQLASEDMRGKELRKQLSNLSVSSPTYRAIYDSLKQMDDFRAKTIESANQQGVLRDAEYERLQKTSMRFTTGFKEPRNKALDMVPILGQGLLASDYLYNKAQEKGWKGERQAADMQLASMDANRRDQVRQYAASVGRPVVEVMQRDSAGNLHRAVLETGMRSLTPGDQAAPRSFQPGFGEPMPPVRAPEPANVPVPILPGIRDRLQARRKK